MTKYAERLVTLGRPLDLGLTGGPMQHGRHDPCVRLAPGELLRATRTPFGAATLLLCLEGRLLRARAWGDGADWILDHVPDLVGENDGGEDFEPRHPLVKSLHRRSPGLRIARTAAVVEALIPAIIEQRVTSMEAKSSYRRLVHWLGEPAPGPAGATGLWLPPSPQRLAATPSWALHRLGIERKRAETIRRVASAARRLDETAGFALPDAYRRLRAIPGVGPWTAAEAGLVAFGDADAVSVGDFHLHDHVVWALTGEPRGDDRRMLEVLAPFAGHRGRVVRLIVTGHRAPPKYGPRYSPLPIATM